MAWLLLATAPLQAQGEEARNVLGCFSLEAARRELESGRTDGAALQNVGFITRIWGALLDERGGVIVIGERDPRIPPMSLDDVAMAVRTREAMRGKDSPGVSIEPPRAYGNARTQGVRYFGGIAGTHYGRMCFEADLLLKYMSLGFAPGVSDRHPNEWDLWLDNERAGREIEPWGRVGGRSWFFPIQVGIHHRNRCASITALTVAVQTTADAELEQPTTPVQPDPSLLAGLLGEEPDAVPSLFARFFNQNFEQIALRHPVLFQLENMIALGALLQELSSESDTGGLEYWEHTYRVEPFETPPEVPLLSRGVNGPVYSNILSGGVRGCYDVDDAWTEYTCARDPEYLREAALAARPDRNAVAWIVPLGHGTPREWVDTPGALERARRAEGSNASMLVPAPKVESVRLPGSGKYYVFDAQGHLTRSDRRPVPLETPGWRPRTRGRGLVCLLGKLLVSSGGQEAYSPTGRFSVSGSELSVGMLGVLGWALGDRLQVEAIVPFKTQVRFQDQHVGGLLPTKRVAWGYALGIDSPVIDSRLQLVTGIRHGFWQVPGVVLRNDAIVPTSAKFAGSHAEGTAQEQTVLTVSFGRERWLTAHAVEVTLPVGSSASLGLASEYQRTWAESGEEQILLGGVAAVRTDQETGMTVGLQGMTSSSRVRFNSDPFQSDGFQLLAVLSAPAGAGLNSFSCGWYFPPRAGAGGTFLASLNLDGSRLWDFRRWF